ncbi:acyltransferase family protein [Ramlibacter tataouinensis]|uniref:Acyltransferase, membrane protein-like protein n=1 Tax=Ramlibacter tataouinensis (strain ATCC BAA-407 / DSM 14655 / LMG 21543 / TTB310) TaxID=365046 RepID=F5XZU6_RAMTT|nr:acyltransferase family protein [Ramlibacter tataouinensis]AEG93307.1 acyltransferase, membrane protein-like protein [Ramlibacter tataouinensis TTB310]
MSAPAYRPDIDGLRAVAVLAVVVHHFAYDLLPGGYVGVDVFFVISGYLITRIIAGEMAAGRFSFLRFYERRARRIFPALFAMLGATLLAGYLVLLPSDYAATLKAALATLLFASNFVFWRQEQGYFEATEVALNPLLHTWSLGVEEQFYLLFPIALLLCWRAGRRGLFHLLLVGALVSLALATSWVRANSSAVFYLAPFRAWELLAGALLALGHLPPVRSAAGRELMVGAGVAAITASCVLYDGLTVFPGLAALLPVGGAVLVIQGGAGGATRMARLLQCRPMVALGLVSYSLYLWHWPMLVFAQYLNGLAPLPTWTLPALLAASLLLAAGSYRFIEQPWRRPTLRPRRLAIASAGFAAIAAAIAVAGLAQDGYAGRFEPAVALLDGARQPDIPYMECAQREPQDACRLGDANAQPDMAFWGDSHMIAWAPALHASLREQGKAAVLFVTTGCAPLIEVDSLLTPSCLRSANAVQQHLQAHPQLRSVVLAGFWSTYFRDEGPLRSVGPGLQLEGLEAARQALMHTLDWLHAHQRSTVLIGPVPVHDRSVPAALALERVTGRDLLDSSLAQQRQAHAAFLQIAQQMPQGPQYRWVDPLGWLCNGGCTVVRDGVPLYRDAHHLSLAGAMALKPRLDKALKLPAGSPMAR